MLCFVIHAHVLAGLLHNGITEMIMSVSTFKTIVILYVSLLSLYILLCKD